MCFLVSVKLWYYCQGQIIAIATLVIGLEIVAIDADDSSVGQIMKGANNRCLRSVIDNREDLTDRERACPSRAEGKLGSAIDCYPVGNDFVRPGTVGVEFVNISRVVIQSKTALDGEGGWFLCS